MGLQVVSVANFLRSMPHIVVTVRFDGDEGKITERTGYTHDSTWDKLAIEAALRLREAKS